MELVQPLTGWESVTAHADGPMVIRLKDGTDGVLIPSGSDSAVAQV
jgi:hypothetical protein